MLYKDLEKMLGTSLEGLVIVLRGPVGSGKSTFCKTLLKEVLEKGKKCLYFSTSQTEEVIKERFKTVRNLKNLKIMTLYSSQNFNQVRELNSLNFEINNAIKAHDPSLFVFDSITSLLLNNDAIEVAKFIQRLVVKLRQQNIFAVFVVDSEAVDNRAVELVSYFVDSILETKINERYEKMVRVYFARFAAPVLKWKKLKINEKGEVEVKS